MSESQIHDKGGQYRGAGQPEGERRHDHGAQYDKSGRVAEGSRRHDVGAQYDKADRKP